MNLQEDNVIGIVGGMGPEAGLFLFNNIIRHTVATTDQQHLSVILMSFPKHIADRTSFLQGDTSDNPATSIVQIIRKLEHAGAKTVGMACNTSYAPEIFNVVMEALHRLNSQVALVHMPRETCKFIKDNHPQVRRVGVMSTNGTYRSNVYKKLLEDLEYDVVLPERGFQNEVIHRMIYDPKFGIKSSPNHITKEVRSLLETALSFFRQNGSDAVILGCTELSLALAGNTAENMLIVDSSEVMAKALIREAMLVDFSSNP